MKADPFAADWSSAKAFSQGSHLFFCHSLMEICRPSKLLAYIICLLIFGYGVIVSFIKWHEGKVAISMKEVKSKYAKFPSISICLDQDVKKEKLGFKKIRPLNETLRDLDYVRHFNNGYVNVYWVQMY